MPIQISDENESKIVVVQLSGTLLVSDYDDFVPQFERLVGMHGKLRVLLDMSDFHGWKPGALWKEIEFDVKHMNDIERLAVIGSKEWQKNIAAISKPFTKTNIRYFDTTGAAEARKWLTE